MGTRGEIGQAPKRQAPFADEMPVGVFTSSAQGEIDYVNAALCELTGLSEERSLGYGWLDAVR